jgi:hypothetical protein
MKQIVQINSTREKEVSEQTSESNYKTSLRNVMTKFIGVLLLAVAIGITSCEGPIGEVGPPGEDGYIGSVFEIQGDFTSGNNYNLYTEFPNSITVYDTDVVLVYILWDVVDGLDVWRLCPQTIVLDDGVIQYNFDYTFADVQVFMEFTVPEISLLPAETNNQVFRIAVLPADFAALKSVDVSDYNTILQAPEIQLKSLNTIELETIRELN